MTTAPSHLTLAHVQCQPPTLTLTYQLRNDWGHTVYLFNRLFHTEPSGKITLDASCLYAEMQGETLHLAKQLVPIPPLMKVESPEVPYLTPVASGATLTEELVIPVPVREYWPYREPTAMLQPKERRTCKDLVLTLGLVVGSDPSVFREVLLEGERLAAVRYGQGLAAQKLIHSAAVPVRCECLVFADDQLPRPRS